MPDLATPWGGVSEPPCILLAWQAPAPGKDSMSQIPVIDLFAGPGGLNEGFSRSSAECEVDSFRVAASFEMDAVACRTLKTRAAVRSLEEDAAEMRAWGDFLRGGVDLADWSSRPAVERALEHAASEVNQVELGPDTRDETEMTIRGALGKDVRGPWVLIGGPPCQAYSLVGRSRRRHDASFADDVKHYLYREYLHIIEALRPPVFVMENVKGLLSHRHNGRSMFDLILEDLRRPGYEIRSFVTDREDLKPEDFVIRSEEHGIPQRRHRVILLGVREDLAGRPSGSLSRSEAPTVQDVLGHLPKIRSRVSPSRLDDEATWRELRDVALRWAGRGGGGPVPSSLGAAHGGHLLPAARGGIEGWLTGGRESAVIQHEARGHMPGDLQRYAYIAAKAERGEAVKVSELPRQLQPLHRNALREDAPFADRFRVQLADKPSTTVVSHISKDGHYYIHPDPDQMRSLSVREAARLQTFPDDYYFCGNRTQQYHQVGNAVPPLLAHQLAGVVRDLLIS